MEQQYRKSIITLFAVLICFCIVTTGYFLFAVGIFIKHNDENLQPEKCSNGREEKNVPNT